jgi:hypothetical protein
LTTAIELKDVVTLSVALLGAVLGVMNTWNAMSQRRVRLRVTPAYSIQTGSGAIGFNIEVVNLSTFPITIEEVGFYLSGSDKRMVVTEPIFYDGKPWPRRLESHDSMSAHFDPREFGPHAQNITKAYARISSGGIYVGTSPALKQLRDIASEVYGRSGGQK